MRKKGNITIDADRGWLRLRFRVQGKSYRFALRLPDSIINRKIAQGKVDQIQLDILSGNFDPTLVKYKPPKTGSSYCEGLLTAPALFEDFIRHKAKHVNSKTIEKYQSTLKYVREHFESKPVDFLGLEDAEKFIEVQRLAKHPTNRRSLSSVQIKRRVEELAACWD